MSDMKNRYYEWTNEVFAASPFDLKTNNLLSLVAALMAGNPGAINYFHGAAKKAGASEAELAAVADLAVAASGLNLYALWPKE